MNLNEFEMGQGQTESSPLAPEQQSDQWQTPPDPIAQMLATDRSPAISISADHRWLLELTPPKLPSIAELAEPVLSLAGLKINPKTWGPAGASGYRAMALRSLLPQANGKPLPADTPAIPIQLPTGAIIRNITWSYDCSQLAFTLMQTCPSDHCGTTADRETSPETSSDATTEPGIALWIVDVATRKARQLTPPKLNGTYGRPYAWLPNGEGFICKLIPPDWGDPPVEAIVPQGPRIAENDGRTAPARTYTNLL